MADVQGSRPTDDELRPHFPAHDFDGYWFFGGLRGDGPFTALMFGLGLGANDGYDWGFKDVVPDPDFGVLACQVVGPEGSLGFGRQPIHRHEFAYDRRTLDIRLGDEARLAVAEGVLQVHLADLDGTRSLDLEGRLPDFAVWTPDMIFRGTSFVSVAIPSIAFAGVFRDGDRTYELDGVGVLDHPSGRNRRSETSVGMGWWEYNGFMVEEEYGLFQWFIVDRDGNRTLATMATDYPDHRLHVGDVDLTYTEWEQRGEVAVPRRWSVTAHLDHGDITADIHAAGPPWDGVDHVRGMPLPNFALDLRGCFTAADGSTATVRGRGTGETVLSERDPHRDVPQDPW